MNDTTLRELFEQTVKSSSCSKYYCTTCGGISFSVRTSLASSQLKDKLFNLEQIIFLPIDFKKMKDQGFPKELQCSDFVLFLKELILELTAVEQKKLINIWKARASSLENFIIDGIGYYLVPEEQKEIWLPLLLNNSGFDSSIKETLCIKYNH